MRIFHDSRMPRRLALTGAIVAALGAGTAGADYMGDAGWPDNVVRYQVDLDGEQSALDRRQAELDRRQAELDRRKYRFREQLQDARWRFDQLDANEDLRVSEQEAVSMPAVARAFDRLDDDDDGTLTRMEFRDLALYTLPSTSQ